MKEGVGVKQIGREMKRKAVVAIAREIERGSNVRRQGG